MMGRECVRASQLRWTAKSVLWYDGIRRSFRVREMRENHRRVEMESCAMTGARVPVAGDWWR